MKKRLTAPLLFCLLIALTVSVAGCGSNSNDGGPSSEASTNSSINQDQGGPTAGGTKIGQPSGEEPPPIQILSSGETGIHVNEPTVRIIHSNADFKALLKEHFSHGVKRQDVAGTQFPDRQIVAVIFPKSPRGTQVAVTAVNEIKGQVVVKVAKIKPNKKCKVGGPMPRPIALVDTRGMPSSDKPKLVVVNMPTDC